MLRYRIKVIKKYIFDLDASNEDNIRKQLDYIMNETNILDIPYVKKKVNIKIQKIRKKVEKSR